MDSSENVFSKNSVNFSATVSIATDGEKGRKHRRLGQPAYHMKSINGFFEVMVRSTDRLMRDGEQSLNHDANLRDNSTF